MTVFGTSILRFLRPRRPVLADPLLQAVLAHNPGGVDFGRAVSYLERALPGASNEWTEAMVTSRPLAFGIHSWVRVRILERVELVRVLLLPRVFKRLCDAFLRASRFYLSLSFPEQYVNDLNAIRIHSRRRLPIWFGTR